MLNGGGLNPDGLSLDLQFAADKTLTARRGPTPTFSRASSGTFVNANGLIVGKTAGTTSSITPNTQAIGSQVTVTVASGSVVGWVVGQAISLIVDTDGQDDPDATELWLLGNIVSTTDTTLVFSVTSRTTQAGSATSWTLGYRGPRFDHTSAGVCRGLLIEEGRTNQITFSEDLTDGSWSFFATASAANITSTNPSGGTTTSRLTANSGTGTGRARVKLLNLPSASYAATVSCFVKAGNSDFGLVSMAFNKAGVGGIRVCNANIVFSTGVITKSGTSNADFTVTSTAFPDGWYRITISATSNASLTVEDQVVLYAGLAFNGTGGSGTFAGTETVLAWGAQFEAGSFATSYIPTTTGTLARSADVCSITGSDFNNFYNQSEGSLFAAYSFVSGYTNVGRSVPVAQASNNTFNELVRIGSAASATSPSFDTTVGGLLTRTTALNNFNFSGINKTSGAYIVGNNAISHNGNAVVTSSPAAITSSCNRLDIGKFHPGSPNLPHNGHIAAIRYYKKRLPNSKLQALTA